MNIESKTSFPVLKNDIIDKGLCSHCNMCIECCPVNVIDGSKKEEGYRPFLSGKCISCGTCASICPGRHFDFKDAPERLCGEVSQNRYIGRYRSIYLGFAENEKIRYSGASGGVVTAILLYLLKSGQIKGASVITTTKDKSWVFTRKIVEDEEGILRAAQSKYTIPQTIDRETRLRDYTKELAFVGLPCQIQALRKYEKALGKPVANIKFYLGLYCGSQLYFNATESLLKRFGVTDYRDIKSLDYRSGPWPGEFKVTLKNEKTFSVKRITFNYLNLLYKVPRCLTCIDLTSEYADISCGDGWMREESTSGKGYSVVIARSAAGEELLQKARKEGVVKLESIGEKDAQTMHAHLLDNKKIGSFIRMSFMSKLGRDIPDYNLLYPMSSRKRKIHEFFIYIVFLLGDLGVSRFVANLIPLRIIEKMLGGARKRWIKESGARL